MMGKNLKEKKAELTTQQIVLLIILLVSFVIILFLLVRLNFKGESEKELCYNSVMMRGSAAVPAEATPLKCSTTYICITKDGTCEGLTKPEVKKVKTKEEIYQILADEMAGCWWMFGEGKVDYIGDKTLKKNYCSICSQIFFDNSLNEIKDKEGESAFSEGKISKDELYEYLFENKYSEDETYAQYLFRENNLEKLKKEIINHEENTGAVGTFGEIEIGKNQYYVLMGITSEIDNAYKWIGGGIAVAGVILTFPLHVVGVAVGAIIVGTGIATGSLGGQVAGLFEPEIGALIIEGNGIPNNFMAPTIIEAEPKTFEKLNCKDIKTLL